MPLTRYAVLLGLALGLLIGLGGFTFIYAKGASYLTNDPNACVNCHVMQEQFDGWVTLTIVRPPSLDCVPCHRNVGHLH